MLYNGISVEFNATLEGLQKTYECLEVRQKDVLSIDNTGAVCITCYVTLPLNYHYLTIVHHKDSKSLMKYLEKMEHAVYSSFFIPATLLESHSIIEDIKAMHPEIQ